VRLVLQSHKTAVFITCQINEAMEIGDRVLVFHRPARVACKARLDAPLSAAARGKKIQDAIMGVLSAEPPAA
jgi:ABC-type nitrate/sulfonate/bicarbonate transport system ATPase subunit